MIVVLQALHHQCPQAYAAIATSTLADDDRRVLPANATRPGRSDPKRSPPRGSVGRSLGQRRAMLRAQRRFDSPTLVGVQVAPGQLLKLGREPSLLFGDQHDLEALSVRVLRTSARRTAHALPDLDQTTARARTRFAVRTGPRTDGRRRRAAFAEAATITGFQDRLAARLTGS